MAHLTFPLWGYHDIIPFMPRTASLSPAEDLRGRTLEWKRQSLAQTQELISSLQKIKKELSKAYGVVKTTVRSIHSGAKKLHQEYERRVDDREDTDGDEDEEEIELEQDGEDLDEDEVMASLDNLSNVDDQVEDAKLQIEESLEGLIGHLEEQVRDLIKEVNP